MDRRDFIKISFASAGMLSLGSFPEMYARGSRAPEVGRVWEGWKEGQFQIHCIYTGVAESLFLIFPDGTSMLLDCGDIDVVNRKNPALVPILPHPGKHSGEWIARYVARVNPHGEDVDYMMLSHYHADHAGNENFFSSSDGDYRYSGFSEAAKTLRFGKAFDRSWPDFSDPLPMPDSFDNGAVLHMKKFYRKMIDERGMEVEHFRLDSSGQVALKYSPAAYKNFSVRNICANGRILYPDGTVKDLYADRIREKGLSSINENGLSLGMVISYGPFRFFTAGDFSDKWVEDDGSTHWTEDDLAEVCGPCNVAKINHHGHYSMTPKLVAALRSQVYVNCVWNQRHTVSDVMDTISDRSLYPEDRIVCPGILPPERRAVDSDKDWMKDICPASFDACHVVINVENGGRKFSVTHIGASDESMIVRSHIDFRTIEY